MEWVRIDVDILSNPKVAQLTAAQFRLYVALACHCAQHETDGFVDGVAAGRMARSLSGKWGVKLLMGLGVKLLIEEVDGGWYVPGFLERNPSREQVERERKRARERAANARASRRDR